MCCFTQQMNHLRVIIDPFNVRCYLVHVVGLCFHIHLFSCFLLDVSKLHMFYVSSTWNTFRMGVLICFSHFVLPILRLYLFSRIYVRIYYTNIFLYVICTSKRLELIKRISNEMKIDDYGWMYLTLVRV